MCTPTIAAVVTIATSVAGQTASIMAQSASASAQESFQSKLAESRNLNFLKEAQNANEQKAQIRESSARELFRASQVSDAAEATARTSLAEDGAGGVSVDALLADYQFQKGVFNESALRQEQLGVRGVSTGIESSRRAVAFDSERSAAPINQPNYIGAGLGTVASGFETANRYGLFEK